MLNAPDVAGAVGRRGGVGLRVGRAARDGPDPRDKFPHSERLHQVVVRPELQGQHAVDFLVTRADHDDRRHGQATGWPADVRAVHVRQAQVKEHEIRAGAPNLGERPCPVGDMPGLEAGPGQALQHAGGNGFVIFNHEDLHIRLSSGRNGAAADSRA